MARSLTGASSRWGSGATSRRHHGRQWGPVGAGSGRLVRLFLEGRIRFPEIARNVRRVLDRHTPGAATSVEAILAADREARALVDSVVGIG